MSKKNDFYRVTMLLMMTLLANKSYSVDIVTLQNQQLSENKAAHNIEIIRRALEITEEEYGPYKINVVHLTMSKGRLHKSIIEGTIFNTVMVLSDDLWDKTTIGIKIPVRLGLLSYRLLLVNKSNLKKFEKITNLEDLNTLNVGSVIGWNTTKIFEYHNMNMTTTGHFNGIFLMLAKYRFDYIPRGVYEIYDELNSRPELLKEVVVEPTIALYIPTIVRVYVSPSAPRLAKRIDTGLHKMLVNGEIEEILYKYYGDDIKRANLSSRKIINIDNPYYNKNEGEYFKDLLFKH